jgi:hypothetical protein
VRRGGVLAAFAVAAVVMTVAAAWPALAAAPGDRKPRQALFVGLDTSGSFKNAGYDDALSFVAYYIYGHLNELGGLRGTRELFVAAIGGKEGSEPKAFHPIHDFSGKSVAQIEADLRAWFPPTDTLTDFNSFFRQVARIAKERNLLLAPITVMVVSDGVPDVPGVKPGALAGYEQIDLRGLEYLSRHITVRLTYASPKVGDHWRKLVPRQRVRLWAVEAEIMKGWRSQMRLDSDPAGQDRLWKWVKDNVDYRVRSRGI